LVYAADMKTIGERVLERSKEHGWGPDQRETYRRMLEREEREDRRWGEICERDYVYGQDEGVLV
jgi:hypothetical protein